MCICDLYDVDPKRREKLACLESMIRMRDAVREADAINNFMPAKAAEANPCADAVAAGAYHSTGVAA